MFQAFLSTITSTKDLFLQSLALLKRDKRIFLITLLFFVPLLWPTGMNYFMRIPGLIVLAWELCLLGWFGARVEMMSHLLENKKTNTKEIWPLIRWYMGKNWLLVLGITFLFLIPFIPLFLYYLFWTTHQSSLALSGRFVDNQVPYGVLTQEVFGKPLGETLVQEMVFSNPFNFVLFLSAFILYLSLLNAMAFYQATQALNKTGPWTSLKSMFSHIREHFSFYVVLVLINALWWLLITKLMMMGRSLMPGFLTEWLPSINLTINTTFGLIIQTMVLLALASGKKKTLPLVNQKAPRSARKRL